MKRSLLVFLVISLGGLGFTATAKEKKPLQVATYNIRMNTTRDGINAWPHRKENVKALIRFHEFDIFGVQEAFIEQIKDISTLGDFGYTGKGRDDGREKGEHSAIFYKKDRLKLLKSGDFWLREQSDKPGLGWDATCCNRICSWGKFRDLSTKKEFFFFSVHFDHQGVVARKESAKLMIKKIKEIAGDKPVICVGDFNSTPEMEQIITMKSFLKDSHDASEQLPYGPEGTFNGFQFDAPLKERIDYIWVSDKISVLKYGVLTDSRDQRYPSDHQPVVAKVVME